MSTQRGRLREVQPSQALCKLAPQNLKPYPDTAVIILFLFFFFFVYSLI